MQHNTQTRPGGNEDARHACQTEAVALAEWLDHSLQWLKSDLAEAVANKAELVAIGHAEPEDFLGVLLEAGALVDGLRILVLRLQEAGE